MAIRCPHCHAIRTAGELSESLSRLVAGGVVVSRQQTFAISTSHLSGLEQARRTRGDLSFLPKKAVQVVLIFERAVEAAYRRYRDQVAREPR